MRDASQYRGRTVGLPDFLYAQPLQDAFTEHLKQFSCLRLPPKQVTQQLQEKQIDAAILSPIEYARRASELLLIPNVGISSYLGTNSVRLHFKQGLSHIETLAADPNFPSEIVLAHILLAEHYDSTPSIIPMQGNVSSMLTRADAALIVSDGMLSPQEEDESLDLTELWQDLMDLPFVHGLFVSSEDSLLPSEIHSVSSVGAIAQLSIGDEVEKMGMEEIYVPPSSIPYLSRFSYQFGEEEVESIKEFFRLAFYYRSLPDIPDIRFHSLQSSILSSN